MTCTDRYAIAAELASIVGVEDPDDDRWSAAVSSGQDFSRMERYNQPTGTVDVACRVGDNDVHLTLTLQHDQARQLMELIATMGDPS